MTVAAGGQAAAVADMAAVAAVAADAGNMSVRRLLRLLSLAAALAGLAAQAQTLERMQAEARARGQAQVEARVKAQAPAQTPAQTPVQADAQAQAQAQRPAPDSAAVPAPAAATASSPEAGMSGAGRIGRRMVPAGGPAGAKAAAAGVKPGAAAAQPLAPGHVAAWVSTADQSLLLVRQPDIALGAPSKPVTPWSPGVATAGPLPAGPHLVDIGLAHPAQPVIGFGAALSAASAWLLTEKLDAPQRAALLDELFGDKPAPRPGLGLGFMRLYLGASEFARSRYSYDELPDGGDDPGLAQMNLAPDREAVIPLALEALARNPALEFVGSPTTAPGWMKAGGGLVQGALKPEAYGAYARYVKRIADLYLEEGIPLYALTLQNDPQAPQADAPGMQLDAAARTELAGKHLGPLLQEGGPRLLEWDGDWDGAQSALKVMSDKAAGQYIAGAAWHCHGGAAGAQSALRAALPASETYITECTGGAWAPDWGGNLLYFARTLAQGMRHGARGIALGNLALDEQGGPRTGGCRGCRGVLTITADGGVQRNPEYYALAHVSRWVRPGARALPAGEGRGQVEQAAFLNADGSVVLLLVNGAAEPRPVAVRAGTHGFLYTLPAGSVATLMWQTDQRDF